MPHLAKKKLCTGCLACKDACIKGAIRIKNRHGMVHVDVDSTQCVECRLCEKVCPIVSPQEKNKVSDMKSWGGWAIDEYTRYNSASGGAFSALAQSFFMCHPDAIVVGACLQNNTVFHHLIDKKEDIPLLSNSKYVQSDPNITFKQVFIYFDWYNFFKLFYK